MNRHMQVNTKLAKLIDEVGEKQLAKIIRRSLYVLTTYHLDKDEPFCRDWVCDSVTYLTDLAECFDPQLEDEP